MTYAQIKDEIIQNVIVLDDMSLLDIFGAGFDAIVRIDQLNPMPAIYWTYDGSVFTPPEDGG